MMNEANTHNRPVWKRGRWLWIPLLLLLLVLALARLSLKTAVVQQWVKGRIEAEANARLNAHLDIGGIDGDLWNEMILSDIRLTQKQDTVASADTLHMQYRIWSLFEDQFDVRLLRLAGLFVRLEQDSAGWNVSSWVKEREGKTSIPGIVARRIELKGGRLSLASRSLPGDSLWAVSDIHLDSRFSYLDETYSLSLDALSFRIEESVLGGPVTVDSRWEATDKTVTLQKLAIATGTSMLDATGRYSSPDSTVQFQLNADPLSWRNMAAFAAGMPVRNDLQVGLEISGTLEKFNVSLALETAGLEKAEISAGFTHGRSLVLNDFSIDAGRVNLNELSGREDLPEINGLHASATGKFPLDTLQVSEGKGTLRIARISREGLALENMDMELSLRGHGLDLEWAAGRQSRQFNGTVFVNGVWDARPSFRITANGNNVNPAYWLQDDTYEGDISFSGSLSGRGWSFEEADWTYDLQLDGNRLFEQAFRKASFKGSVQKGALAAEGALAVEDNEITYSAEINMSETTPSYTFTLDSRKLNLADFRDLESYETALTMNIQGRGRGFEPEALESQATVRIDSSVVNGEFIESFTSFIEISDTTAYLRDTELASSIADGSLAARVHLLDIYRPSNNLDLDLHIEDISSLAPLVEVQDLGASGSVKGQLKPGPGRALRFTGSIDLSDLRYGQMFTSDKAAGEVELAFSEKPAYTLNIRLANPVFERVALQDFLVRTEGTYTDTLTRGEFTLQFSSRGEGKGEHSGQYSIWADSSVIHTRHLELSSGTQTLSLAKPFNITVRDASIEMDTLSLQGSGETRLVLAVPYADSVSQQVYMNGSNFDVTTVQDILLQDHYFGGVLSGHLEVNRSDTVLTASANIDITEIEYRGTRFERFAMDLRIENYQLESSISLVDGQKTLISGALSVPFKLEDPARIEEQFFEQPVKGDLAINSVDLARFEPILAQAGFTGTSGILKARGTLSGRAGSPDFDASATLDKARLSGVSLDSIIGDIQYEHSQSLVRLNGTVISLRQKAAEINAVVPLYIDLKAFSVTLPDENDSITANIVTNDFDLAALNDFVNRDHAREISGRLNGAVQVSGEVSNLQAGGTMQLTGGSLRVVPAGIRVHEIRSTLDFASDQIIIREFAGRSSNGNLQLSGTIGLEQLTPGALDLSVNARNFKIANTADANANVNIQSQIDGTLTRPAVKGRVEFINGFVYLRNFGERSVEDIDLDAQASGVPGVALYDSLALELDVSFNRRFFVRNRRYLEMELELDGQLDLVKEPGKELQAFGTLTAPSGYATPLGKRFSLQEGALNFVGDPANPGLNIRTLYQPPQPKEEINIWYTIEGTVESPVFSYNSDPPMELENIISYTLFGQPFYALDSWKQVVASSGSNTSVTDVALEVLMDRIETLATRKLGIDVVQIDNTRVGGEGGTSITTGWYISPRVFFAIQNVITGSTPDTGFLLEYKIWENLKLIISQGNDSRQGIDLKWNYEY